MTRYGAGVRVALFVPCYVDQLCPDVALSALELLEAQKNIAAHGAIEERFAGDVRSATPEEPLDPGFRPISAQSGQRRAQW